MSAEGAWERFFAAHAEVYDENSFTRATLAEVDFLLEELRPAPGAALLDMGCGTGRHSVELARRGFRVTGVDLSPHMLAQARAKAAAAGVQLTLIQADATRFRAEGAFDAAICLCEGAFGLLSASDDPIGQPLAILRNLSASLRPGAPLLLTALNAAAMIRRYSQADVDAGRYDLTTLVERSELEPRPGAPTIMGRERGFVATELRLLFDMAGLDVRSVWGGTAGRWGRRPPELDEVELMLVGARRS